MNVRRLLLLCDKYFHRISLLSQNYRHLAIHSLCEHSRNHIFVESSVAFTGLVFCLLKAARGRAALQSASRKIRGRFFLAPFQAKARTSKSARQAAAA
jgi:hypothetical protein